MKNTTSGLNKTFLAASLLTFVMCLQPVYAHQQEAKMNEDFMKAIMQGDVTEVKAMLKANAPLAQAQDQKSISAILKAAYSSKREIVAVLLAAGIELSIFEADATGQTERVRTLLKRDPALANAFAADGFMPLGLAVFFGHFETVEALLAAVAEVNAVTRETRRGRL